MVGWHVQNSRLQKLELSRGMFQLAIMQTKPNLDVASATYPDCVWHRLNSVGTIWFVWFSGGIVETRNLLQSNKLRKNEAIFGPFLTKHATAVSHRVRRQEPLVKNEEYFTMSLEPRLIISTNTLKLHDLDLHTTREGG